VSGPDFAAIYAFAVAANMLSVATSQAGRAVDAADRSDCLSPFAWTLALAPGAPADAALPLVRHISAHDGSASPTRWDLLLDAPLTPGATYRVGLAPLATSFNGQPTSTLPVALVAPPVVGIAAQAPGVLAGDAAFPLRGGGPGGDVALATREEALRERLRERVIVRLGAWSHLPGFGRALDVKRMYSPSQATQVARDLKASLLTDEAADLKRVDVSVAIADAGYATVTISAVTRAGARATFDVPIGLGSSTP